MKTDSMGTSEGRQGLLSSVHEESRALHHEEQETLK